MLDFLNPDSGGCIPAGSDINNVIPARNVYPTAPGATLGQVASAMTPDSADGTYSAAAANNGNAPTAGATTTGGGVFGQPLTWWIVFAALLVALHFISKRAGEGASFASIKVTFWNVLVIAIAAAVGLGFLKVVFGRVQVAGLSDYIRAV